MDWSDRDAVASGVVACARALITALERGAARAADADQRAMRQAALKVRVLDAAPPGTAEDDSP